MFDLFNPSRATARTFIVSPPRFLGSSRGVGGYGYIAWGPFAHFNRTCLPPLRGARRRARFERSAAC